MSPVTDMVEGDVAMVWSPYFFERDGELSASIRKYDDVCGGATALSSRSDDEGDARHR